METPELKTYQIPALDLLHYYFKDGKISGVIYYEITLKEEISKDILKEALGLALKDIPHFSLTPIIVHNEIRFKENKEEPLVLTDKTRVNLASKEVNNFLFAVIVKERTIHFHFHHSLADGRGCLNFLKNVLFHYYTLKGEKIDPEGLILLKEKEGMFKPYAESHIVKDNKPFGKYNISPDVDMFHIPDAPVLKATGQGQLYQIKCPMKPILDYSKRSDSTPVPFLAIMLYNALRQAYKTEDKLIIGGSAVDYRVIFKDEVINNAAGGTILPCFSRMKDLDLPTQMTIIRARLDLELQKENLIADMQDFINRTEAFKSIPLPVEQVPGLIYSKISAMKSQRDFYISYVGGVRFPHQMQEHIQDLEVSFPPFLMPNYIMGIETNGILNISLTQGFTNPALSENLYKLLKKEIPETILINRGIQDYDELDLSKVEKL
ncbi:MAG: hypothetical protein LKJ88_03335 [Bacilli bacterium]|jgi:hypothetical protein|nr:hypothetical protein [Bacilli bacterium]